jgi:hypothetical protein
MLTSRCEATRSPWSPGPRTSTTYSPSRAARGLTASVDGPEVLLTIPVRAPDARTALATARETATDLLLVLASTFNGYELVVDVRQVTRRTDAVYQDEGPIPPLNVAEGEITEYGVRGRRLGSVCRRARCWPSERY